MKEQSFSSEARIWILSISVWVDFLPYSYVFDNKNQYIRGADYH